MKVQLIKRQSIITYITKNANSKAPFTRFLQLIQFADWNTLEDVTTLFPKASVICEGKRIIFRIGGNNYRMICGFKIGQKRFFLYIKFIGTHAEYDKLNSAKSGQNGVCEVDDFKS